MKQLSFKTGSANKDERNSKERSPSPSSKSNSASPLKSTPIFQNSSFSFATPYNSLQPPPISDKELFAPGDASKSVERLAKSLEKQQLEPFRSLSPPIKRDARQKPISITSSPSPQRNFSRSSNISPLLPLDSPPTASIKKPTPEKKISTRPDSSSSSSSTLAPTSSSIATTSAISADTSSEKLEVQQTVNKINNASKLTNYQKILSEMYSGMQSSKKDSIDKSSALKSRSRDSSPLRKQKATQRNSSDQQSSVARHIDRALGLLQRASKSKKEPDQSPQANLRIELPGTSGPAKRSSTAPQNSPKEDLNGAENPSSLLLRRKSKGLPDMESEDLENGNSAPTSKENEFRGQINSRDEREKADSSQPKARQRIDLNVLRSLGSTQSPPSSLSSKISYKAFSALLEEFSKTESPLPQEQSCQEKTQQHSSPKSPQRSPPRKAIASPMFRPSSPSHHQQQQQQQQQTGQVLASAPSSSDSNESSNTRQSERLVKLRETGKNGSRYEDYRLRVLKDTGSDWAIELECSTKKELDQQEAGEKDAGFGVSGKIYISEIRELYESSTNPSIIMRPFSHFKAIKGKPSIMVLVEKTKQDAAFLCQEIRRLMQQISRDKDIVPERINGARNSGRISPVKSEREVNA